MTQPPLPDQEIDQRPESELDQPEFFKRMIGALCETIEDVVGQEDAESFIGIVGRRIGNSELADFPAGEEPTAEAIGDHLVDFKARIGGCFSVDGIEGDTIRFSNTCCPFGDQAVGRPSLCKMTTNVFGRVAANATGYACVKVDEALSRGDGRCLVTVKLAQSDGDQTNGQEFYA